MYPALIGVSNSWPEWNAMRPHPIYHRGLGRLVGDTGFGSAGIDRFCHLMLASKPGRNLKTQIFVVGLQMWESLQRFPSLALCARRHVQAIRLPLFVRPAAAGKLLL